jgi:group II intron reverse transcriptase/maturase
MDDLEKSDGPMVPTKPSNKAERSDAERVEGRGLAKGNPSQQNAPRTQHRTSAQSALERVREAAERDRKMRFTTLFHHVTIDRLRAAFNALAKNAAPGVDGVTWEQYAAELEGNLEALHAALHRGAYRAKPSKRAFIPKADGRQRPLGMASLEDKIVQRAVVEVLNAIYETDFLGFSYGFRPQRGPHNALDALAVGILRKRVNWVLDADIRGYFDAIDHGWMVKFVEHRIADRRVVRLIQKWLAAGVMENGAWTRGTVGTPQGATISPLLANIYLHYVFDQWAQQWRNRHASGDVVVVRYADDFVVGFEKQSDAEQFLRDLRERFRKFALELHPDKTRLLEFGRFAAERRAKRGLGAPETFDFLGFTHVCGKARSGNFLLARRTIRARMRARLSSVRTEIRRRRHLPIKAQGAWLRAVVRGYFAYYAVPTNIASMQSFRREVVRHWYKALRRRSQRDRTNWRRMSAFAKRWLPVARIQHPWPTERFDVTTRGGSRVR